MAAKQKDHHVMGHETRESLHEGVSVTMLADLFHMDKRKVSRLLTGIEPNGRRRGYPVYRIVDAAQRLATPPEDQIIEALKRTPMEKLPVHLQKEFWAAARSRQIYEENAKDLWRTEDVLEALTEVLKGIRTSVTLFVDSVNRETELTVKQRGLIEELCDDLLANMHSNLTNNPNFSEYTNTKLAQDLDSNGDLDFGYAESEDDDDLGLGEDESA